MTLQRSAGPDAPGTLWSPYLWLALLGALPVLALAMFAYLVSARAVERLVAGRNDATAVITGALVEREFEHWAATMTGIADFPALRAAVSSGDVGEVRRRLRVFVEAHSHLDRAFVTDTTGLLWADYPSAPESLARTFDDRDWFRGVTTARGPYVSEVYRRHAEPQLLVVAVAVPVRAPDTEVVSGFLVAQVLLSGQSELLGRVDAGEGGYVLLLDHTGTLVAHPGIDLQERLFRDYAHVPEVQIEQVVLNLAVNARDAMPRGGKLTVKTANVELDEEYVREHPDAGRGPHVVLAVTDTGTGMDAETRQHIFEPFFTTKQLGSGTGLGLATVYGIVRQGGGNIWVYSEPGRGTTFKVYLPRTDEVPPGPDESPRWQGQTGEGRVLVVEDDEAVRDVVVRILRRAGYEVMDAEDLKSARGAMRRAPGRIDLLLTDVILADTTGPEVAEALSRESPHLQVLYMSGYTDDAIVRHGVLEEGTAYIEKPFRPQELLGRVWEMVSGREDRLGGGR